MPRRRFRPDRLIAEGSIPPPRSRHHVAHHRVTGPRAFAYWLRRWKRPLVVNDRRSPLARLLARVDRHPGRDDRSPAIRRRGHGAPIRGTDDAPIAQSHCRPTSDSRCCFGIWTWYFHGQQFAVEFFAGWLTEYSLSIDNLFIFVIIMTSFAVPKVYQRQALFVGIVIALVLRGVFIALGAVGHSAILLGVLPFRRISGVHRAAAGDAAPRTTQTRRTRSSGSLATHLNVTDRLARSQALRQRGFASGR